MSAMQNHHRTIEIDHKRADERERTAPAVVSTEFPVERSGYREILSHSPGSVDLSRAPLPLVEGHDATRVNVGLVENLHLDGSKLRGTVRLGTSQRARELWSDIREGIVRNLSIGYRWLTYREDDGDVIVTRWQPYEVSLVGAPADPNSGLYRGINMNTDTTTNPEIHLSRRERRAMAQEQDDAASLVDSIRSFEDYVISRRPALTDKVRSIADDHINFGRDFESFRSAVWKELQAYDREHPVSATPSPDFSGAKREYSLINAVRALTDPRYSGAGFELEVSQELSRQSGRRSQGILVPLAMIGQRTIVTPSNSYLIPQQHMAGQFIDVLRARSVVLGMGVRQLGGLQGDVSIPRKTASSTAYWIGEEQSLTESAPTFGSINMAPHTIGGLVTISHRMMLQSSPDIEMLVRNDLADTIAQALDVAAINGDGAGNAPLGLLHSGINSDTYTTSPDWSDLVDMEGDIAANSADAPNMKYLTTPAIATALKVKSKDTGSGLFVWESSTGNSQPGEGRVNGWPAYYSANVPTGYVLFGDWSQLVFATWGTMELLADPYGSNFAKGSVSIRAMMDCDFAVRHAQSFAEIHAE